MLGILDTNAKLRRCVAFERDQKAAHEAVRRALQKRLLTRTHCAACGLVSPLNVFHHADYSRPLDVVELCRPCHIEEHKRLGWGYAHSAPDGWQVEGPHWTPPPGTPSLSEAA